MQAQLPKVEISHSVCPLCKDRFSHPLLVASDSITGETFDIRVCPECGLGVTFPRPADIGVYYRNRYYGGRHSFTASVCVQRRTRLLSRATSRPGRLLDVGCGDGSFLRAAEQAGWQVAGTEIHGPAPLTTCLVYEDLASARRQAPYDCITLWHVLEHLADPVDSLSELHGLLAPGGVLLIAVPDFGGWQARLFGKHWLHLDVPRHLFHFTSFSLQKALGATGYQNLLSWHQELEYDCFGWIQSALNVAGPSANVLFDSLTGKPPRTGRILIAAHYAAAAAMAVPALLLTAAGSIARRGGTLVVAASPV